MTRMGWTAVLATLVALSFSSTGLCKYDLSGAVRLGGQPVSGAKVTLWRTAGKAAPSALAETSTDERGAFKLTFPGGEPGSVLYLTTSRVPAMPSPCCRFSAKKAPPTVVVNELTTVASVFTNARFINGPAISGNEVGLRIAAGNVPNLVDPSTGTWGKVLLDPLNSSQTTTLAKLNTLGNLVTAFADFVGRGVAGRLPESCDADGAPGAY